jgi:hypothetical protein
LQQDDSASDFGLPALPPDSPYLGSFESTPIPPTYPEEPSWGYVRKLGMPVLASDQANLEIWETTFEACSMFVPHLHPDCYEINSLLQGK